MTERCGHSESSHNLWKRDSVPTVFRTLTPASSQLDAKPGKAPSSALARPCGALRRPVDSLAERGLLLTLPSSPNAGTREGCGTSHSASARCLGARELGTQSDGAACRTRRVASCGCGQREENVGDLGARAVGVSKGLEDLGWIPRVNCNAGVNT